MLRGVEGDVRDGCEPLFYMLQTMRRNYADVGWNDEHEDFFMQQLEFISE